MWASGLRKAVLEGEGVGGGEWCDVEEPGQAVVAGEVGVGVDGVEEGEEGGLAKGGDEEAVLGESRAGGSEEGVGNRG